MSGETPPNPLLDDEVTLEWHFKQNYQIDLMAGDQGMGSLNLYWLQRF